MKFGNMLMFFAKRRGLPEPIATTELLRVEARLLLLIGSLLSMQVCAEERQSETFTRVSAWRIFFDRFQDVVLQTQSLEVCVCVSNSN